MKLYDVICAGHAVVDVLVQSISPEMMNRDVPLKNVTILTGGDACNEAVILARLGAKVGFSGTLGNDLGGNLIYQYLKDNKVDTDGIKFSSKVSTTISIVNITEEKKHMLWSYQGGNNALTAAMINYRAALNCKIFNIGSLMPNVGMDFKGLAALCHTIREGGVITSADAVLPHAASTLEDSQKYAEELSPVLSELDYFLPSAQEAQGITGQSDPYKAAKKLLQLGVKHAVIKLGTHGCLIYDNAHHEIVPAVPVPVADTLGAGDNFTAGFLDAMSRGMPFAQCAAFANAVAAVSVTQSGATQGVKNREQILEFIHQKGIRWES